MNLNIFNHKSGKKLTKVQQVIVNICWKIEMYSPFIIPLAVLCGVVYVVAHFLIKYW